MVGGRLFWCSHKEIEMPASQSIQLHVLPYDFSLVGILARIVSIPAEMNISIFAISTYNTDYNLRKSESLLRAEFALRENRYTFR